MDHLANKKMQRIIKPPRLKLGDTIGIVSPSWGGAGMFPHRVETGVKYLESLGFKVRIAPHALNQHGFVSDTVENRVSDLHEMFLDPSVRAIVAAIGGNHSCHLLPQLDFDMIRAHPTILMGFSDITVLNVAIWTKTGLVTFNGPALLTDFAEYPRMLEYTEQSFINTLCRTEPPGNIEPSPWWTEEHLSWSQRETLSVLVILKHQKGLCGCGKALPRVPLSEDA
ncbi:MAG: LD-carboxypeptidase [Alphaproteobacteria bacterium]|nr:LD-carboxypeptidase [Alphaproteobacteria bacterium]